MRHKLEVVLVLIVAVLGVSSVALAPTAGQGVSVVADRDGGRFSMDYSVAPSDYDLNLTAIALEVSRSGQGDIYILVNQDQAFWVKVSLLRLADHLRNELPLLGSDREVTVIAQKDIPDVFDDPNATLIVGPSADLPDFYAIPALNWVSNGGLWVGIGEGSVPFIYSGTNATSPNATLRLDFQQLDYDGGSGCTVQPLAAALGFRYVAPTHAFEVADLMELGGRSIGLEYDRGVVLGTVGILPVGRGAVMVMGGDMDPPPMASSEEVLSWDLEVLLLLDVPWWSGGMSYEIVHSDGRAVVSSLTLDLFDEGRAVSYGVLSHSDAVHRFYIGHLPPE